MLLPTEPLITNPTWIVLVVLGLILFTPMVLERLKIPSIVGLIVAGMLVGPHGVHLLSRDASFEIFGKVGLYYIMFLASLGMNLTDVQRYRWGALAFGTISFVLPMALGFLANRWGLGLSFPAAVLVAAMYSGHTLLTYPLVMRWGLARHRSVGMAVGGTILTNVLTLVVLAVVGGVYKPDGGDFNMWHLLGRVALVTAGLFLVMPSLARWFFRRFDEGVVQYVFVLVLVFLGAGLMEWAGMEGLLGAFLVGIVLNREIPAVGPLMQRIEFVGNALFIPYFLIGVGMIINLHTILSGWHIAAMALAMIVIGTAGKLLAAQLVGRALQFSATERNMVGGLSTARAASALAIAMVGYEIILPSHDAHLGIVHHRFRTHGACCAPAHAFGCRARLFFRKRRERLPRGGFGESAHGDSHDKYGVDATQCVCHFSAHCCECGAFRRCRRARHRTTRIGLCCKNGGYGGRAHANSLPPLGECRDGHRAHGRRARGVRHLDRASSEKIHLSHLLWKVCHRPFRCRFAANHGLSSLGTHTFFTTHAHRCPS